MIILLASDDNFVQHCCVTMTSVLVHNPGAEFYLFTEGLSETSIDLLNKIFNKHQGMLHICKIEHSQLADFPMPSFMSAHISIATYYRLFAERVLPHTIEKILYLDCDIVVRDSLQELWDTNLDSYALAAVYQSHEHSEGSERGPRAYTRLSIPKEDGYFNAGVLLINLKYWREKSVTQRLFDFIKEHHNLIHAHDQDTLNAVLYKETKVLNPTWNYRECFMDGRKYTYPSKIDYSKLPEYPVVIHFVSKPKPWQYFCRHPFRNEYYKYLYETPFSSFKPRWTWAEFKQYRLTPIIYKTIIKIDVFNLRKLMKKFV